MLALIGILLIVWIVLAVVGFVVKSLLWLGIVAVILFLATAAWGWFKRKTGKATAS